MATRFYLANTAWPSGLSTSVLAGWESTTGAPNLSLSRTKVGINVSRAQAETSATSPYRQLLAQWAAGDADVFQRDGLLGGVINLFVATQESSTSADMYVRIRLVVIGLDGTNRTVHEVGTSASQGTEWTTTLTGRQYQISTMIDAPVQAGERVKLEFGYRAANTVSTSFTGTIRYGGTDATDLVAGDTTNATLRSPWLEFTDTKVDDLFLPSPVRHFLAA
mgnify:CR=1 FL=1